MQATVKKENDPPSELIKHSEVSTTNKQEIDEKDIRTPTNQIMIGVNVSPYVYRQCEALAEIYGVTPTGFSRLAIMRFIWINESLLPESLIPISHKERFIDRKYAGIYTKQKSKLKQYLEERKKDSEDIRRPKRGRPYKKQQETV